MLSFYRELKKLNTDGDVLFLKTKAISVEKLYYEYFEDLVLMPIQFQFKNDTFAVLKKLMDDCCNSTKPTEDTATTGDIWIFGYGSLVWKADFPYIDRRRGFICGYQRRFYQNSIDHRGTRKKPGRVVTLIPTESPSDRVYGVAYRVATCDKETVLNYLDYREKNGYKRCILDFHEFPESNDKKFEVIMYIATKDNESYAGNDTVGSIAWQIFTSAGPSGSNREYLFNLCKAMRFLFPGTEDQHLQELKMFVLKLIDKEERSILHAALRREISTILLTCDMQNNDEDEIVVKQLETLRNNCCIRGWKEALITDELGLIPRKS